MISIGFEIWTYYYGFSNHVTQEVIDYWWGKYEPIEDEL